MQQKSIIDLSCKQAQLPVRFQELPAIFFSSYYNIAMLIIILQDHRPTVRRYRCNLLRNRLRNKIASVNAALVNNGYFTVKLYHYQKQ